jgi:hypothetical protein
MNVNATGASTLSALYLQQLLGSTSAATISGSADTGSGTGDLLTISSAGQQASTQATDPFQSDLAQLASSLSSGDLSTAKQEYQAMAAQMAKNGNVPSDFAAIGTALDSGDLSAAQSAMATVAKNVAAHTPPAGGSNPLEQDMDQLGALIQSGDTSDAQTLFASILAKWTDSSATGSSDSSSTSTAGTSGSSSSGTSSSGGTALDQAISNLSSALNSGNTATATSAWQELMAQIQAMQGTGTGVHSLGAIASAAYLNTGSATQS